MAKDVLIVDIIEGRVSAGVFSVKRLKPLAFRTERIEQTQGRTERDGLSSAIASVLAALEKDGFRGFGRVLVSLPAAMMSMRVLTIPIEDMKKVEEVLPLELEGLLPVDVKDVVAGALPLGKGKVLAVSLEKTILADYLALLQESGLDPEWVGSTLFSMHTLLSGAYNGTGVVGLISDNTVTVISDNKPIFFKSFNGADGLGLALGYLTEEGIGVDKFYLTGKVGDDLKTLLADVTMETLSIPQQCIDGGKGGKGGEGVLALALHLKDGLKNTVNLRKAGFENTKERTAVNRSLKVTAALVASIVALLFADLYINYIGMASELSSYEKVLREQYQELFPAQTKVVDELYQLEVAVKGLNEELRIMAAGLSVLDIMNSLARAGNDKNEDMKVKLLEVHAGGGRVVAKGEADSFEGANRVRDSLIKDGFFKEVSLIDVRAAPGGGTRFSVAITLKQKGLLN